MNPRIRLLVTSLLILLALSSLVLAYDYVLSSDDPSDMAVARVLAGKLNARLVVIPWGIADLGSLGGIENGSEILVVGGEVAIPREVVDYLRLLRNCTIDRIGGRDRFETSLLVAENFFSGERMVTVVDGFDPAGLERASSEARAILVINGANIDERTLRFLRNKMLIVIASPRMDRSIFERLGLDLRSFERSEDAPRSLLKKIDRLIGIGEGRGCSNDRLERARRLRDEAREEEPVRAMQLAIAAFNEVRLGLRLCGYYSEESKSRSIAELRRELQYMASYLELARSKEINVTDLEKSLEEVKSLLNEGRIEDSLSALASLRIEIEEILREAARVEEVPKEKEEVNLTQERIEELRRNIGELRDILELLKQEYSFAFQADKSLRDMSAKIDNNLRTAEAYLNRENIEKAEEYYQEAENLLMELRNKLREEWG